MKNAYVDLDRLIRNFDKAQPLPLTNGQRALLTEIARRSEDGQKTTATNLVQLIRLGTGPTVHAHLIALESAGFIDRERSPEDGRAAILSLTKQGIDYMKALDNLVRAAGR